MLKLLYKPVSIVAGIVGGWDYLERRSTNRSTAETPMSTHPLLCVTSPRAPRPTTAERARRLAVR